jgi:hypothetical protein
VNRRRAIVAGLLGLIVLTAATGETGCGAEGPPGTAATGNPGPNFKPKETDLIVEFSWEGNNRRPIYMFYSIPNYVKPADPTCPVGTHSFSALGPSGGITCRWHKFTYGSAHATIWQTGVGAVGCSIATGTIIPQEHDAVSSRKIGEKISCDYDNPKPGNA